MCIYDFSGMLERYQSLISPVIQAPGKAVTDSSMRMDRERELQMGVTEASSSLGF